MENYAMFDMRAFVRTLLYPLEYIVGIISTYFKSFVFIVVVFFLWQWSNPNPVVFNKANVLQIDVEGIILSGRDYRQAFDKGYDEEIKGVLVVINSGGGGVGASVELSEMLKQLAQIKPVIVYGADKMASGAYYTALWADTIIANPGAIIGSIGVVFNGVNAQKLLDKIGITPQTMKKGTYKEVGTPLREWSVSEREQLDKLMSSAYDRFVDQVSQARGIDKSQAELFAQGRVFYAKRAKELGLIDALGTYRDAAMVLKTKSGVDELIWYEEPVDPIEAYLTTLSQSFVNSLVHKLHSFEGLLLK